MIKSTCLPPCRIDEKNASDFESDDAVHEASLKEFVTTRSSHSDLPPRAKFSAHKRRFFAIAFHVERDVVAERADLKPASKTLSRTFALVQKLALNRQLLSTI